MSEKTLSSTLVAALAVETIGALDPAGGKVYLPSPRSYLATWILWFILGLVAATGPRAARLAGQFSLLVVLTMAVVGPFGKKAVAFLNRSARLFPAGGDQAQGSFPDIPAEIAAVGAGP